MMRLVVVLFIYAFGMLAAYHAFSWGACVYLWNNIFRPLEFAYMSGFLPVSHYVAFVLIFSYFFALYKGRIQPKFNTMVLVGGIFIGWLFLSSVFSQFQDLVWNEFFVILKYLIPLMLISSGLNSFKDVSIVMFTLMISVGVWSAQSGLRGLVSGVTSNMAIRGGQMTDNNDFMAATVGILPMLIYFLIYYSWILKKTVKFVIFLILILSATAIIYSQSRGAAIGLFSLFVAYIILGSRKKIRDAFFSLVLLLCVSFILPDAFWSRIETIDFSLSHQTEASAKNRLQLMNAAFDCALDYPLFGVGPNTWLFIAEKYAGEQTEPHSIYIKMACELGFPGVLIFVAFLLNTIYKLSCITNNYRQKFDNGFMINYANFSLAINLSIIGISISFTFLNHPYSEFLWAILGVANAFIFLVPSQNVWVGQGERMKIIK